MTDRNTRRNLQGQLGIWVSKVRGIGGAGWDGSGDAGLVRMTRTEIETVLETADTLRLVTDSGV